MSARRQSEPDDFAAANGIVSRRAFLEGAVAVGALATSATEARTEPLIVQPWMKVPGAGFTGYGQPSRFEDKVVRASPPPGKSRNTGGGCRAHPAPLA